MGESWTCPYCNRPCTIDSDDSRRITQDGFISTEHGRFLCLTNIIVCPNKECRQLTISLTIFRKFESYNKLLYHWQLLPESEAKPFSTKIIPKAILNDYKEACLIKNKSPKASATLSRRCLQGIIRDFWGIKKAHLIDEINELQSKVDTTTWQAIDSVRSVGNIGAHMEKDVNLIIDVEPKEAGLLIWLIETLFTDWYISRNDKQKRMKKLISIAKKKKRKKTKKTTISKKNKLNTQSN